MPSTAAPDFTLTAWIDESVIVGDAHRPGTYTLAAVIADGAAVESLREDLQALTERKIVRLHWVAESAKRRDVIAETIAGLGIVAIVVVGSPVHRQKQERARRCCLERLLYELDQLDVSQAWLESRAPSQDISRGSALEARKLGPIIRWESQLHFSPSSAWRAT
jgi:hypothetical protein